MRYESFDQLITTIRQRSARSRCAVVCAADYPTLEAVLRAKEDGLIDPILIGNRVDILAKLGELCADPAPLTIVERNGAEECAQAAVELVRAGEAQCLMKGLIETSEIMHVVMKKENDMRTGSLVSALSFLELPFYHKLLAMTDAGICMYPTLEQKKDIVRNAVDALSAMGIDTPKVAALCAIEYVNPKMPETVEAAALKEMNQRGEIPGCIVEGPISYDVAMYARAARQKGFDSPVAGDPDLLLWPNITVGNIASKILDNSAGGKGGGLVVGTRAPVILTSRGDTPEGKYRCIALGAAFYGANHAEA